MSLDAVYGELDKASAHLREVVERGLVSEERAVRLGSARRRLEFACAMLSRMESVIARDLETEAIADRHFG